MIVSPEVAQVAIEIAIEKRAERKGADLKPTKVTLFALPDENDITGELVLKVHGQGSALKIVRKPKHERLEGLFAEDRETNEEVIRVELGEDWVYVWEGDLPDWAVMRVLMEAREAEIA